MNRVKDPLLSCFSAVTAWLVSRGLISQVHTYVYLIVPQHQANTKCVAGGRSSEAIGGRPKLCCKHVSKTLRLAAEARYSSATMSSFATLARQYVILEEDRPALHCSCLSSKNSALSQSSAKSGGESNGNGAMKSAVMIAEKISLGFDVHERCAGAENHSLLERDLFAVLQDGTVSYALLVLAAPLFQGSHSLEEIAWRCNISRSDVDTLIDVYGSFLKQCPVRKEEARDSCTLRERL